jgi:cytosine deaminase
MLDLILRNATLPDGRQVDLGIADQHIAAVQPQLQASAPHELQCEGLLVSPPFVDAHFHLDATLSLGQRQNTSGTLLEGIRLWGEIKPELQHEAVRARALRYCDLAVAQGLGAIRAHVDVCDDRLVAVEALLQVQREVRPYLDLQLVAFPQDGIYRDPTGQQNLLRALDLGVDVIGGIPHFERTTAEGDRSVAWLCRLAAERGLLLDLHCDETDDPSSRHVETLAHQVIAHRLEGRATGSHLTSMHGMPDAYVAKLIPLMAEARLAAVANPLINITLQGRFDGYPKRRGMTRVPELMAAGLDVAFGLDCTQDPWYALGSADLLEVAHMGLHIAQMTSQAAMRACFDAVTTTPARILHLEGYGLEPGCQANLVVLQASSPVDAIRLRAPRRWVIRHGRIIAERPPAETQLHLSGRPGTLRLDQI